MPGPYAKLSRDELVGRLQSLESAVGDVDSDRAAVQHELEVHQEELRIQNEHLRQAQHSLELSRDRYADLYDFAPIAFLTLNANGIIQEINLTGAALLQSERATLLGRPLRLFVSPADRGVFDQHLLQCRKGTNTVSSELQLQGREGLPIPTLMRSERAHDEAAGSVLYRSAITDMSDYRNIERERNAAQLREHSAQATADVQDRLIAMVSHELRTPLSAILLWSRILQLKIGDSADCQRALQGIMRSAESQRQLIDDLLDTSRISAGKLRLEPQCIELHALLANAVEALLPGAESRQVALYTELADIGWIDADPNRMRQIFTNLIGNALKFTPAGGRVTIALARVGGEVSVRISDTGKGIDAAFLPQIFQPFRQAEGVVSSREHGGLGLGLTISRQLAQLHGGTIEAASDGVGRGATFTVRLPLPQRSSPHQLPASQAEVPRADHGNGAGGLSGLHVLLVEDEPDTRQALQMLVGEAGAQVIAVDSARAAFDAFQQARPDVLMGDIGIPGEDGYSLIQRLRALEKSAGSRPVPAVALTAFTRSGDREKALAAGFDSHLAKPVEPELLFSTLRTLAGRD
ncbi:MAG: ATP-binding response regulator [Steroidobacteraceae bacterium]